MINQVTNSANKPVFAPLQSNGSNLYAIYTPITESQKTENKKERKKKSKTFGLAIASAALAAAFGVFVVSKLVSGKSRWNMDKATKFVIDKADKLGEKAKRSGVENLFYKALKGTKTVLAKSKAFFNTATLKDIVFVRTLKKVPILKKFNDFTTNLFEKVSIGTSKMAYSKTMLHFDKMYADFAQANTKIPKAEAKLLKQRIQNVRNNYYEAFSEEARNKRFEKVKQGLDGIDKKVWDRTYGDLKKFVRDKDTYQTFIAEDLAHNTKMDLQDSVSAVKRKITSSVYDNYQSTKGLLSNIDEFLDPTDKEARDMMRHLREHLKTYKEVLETGTHNTHSPYLNTDVAQDLTTLSGHILKSGKYDAETIKGASAAIRNLTKTLSENKQGEIQDIMDVYKKYLLKEDYEQLKIPVKKALVSLNKSVDLETDKLFDKVRDLYLGSAPHDALAFLLSLGVVGWYLGKADNTDERISAALQFGIPAIGAVAIATLCTVGLIASGPSLIIGGLSGLVINKLGEGIDEWRKKANGESQD